jgi:hypothetical protein
LRNKGSKVRLKKFTIEGGVMLNRRTCFLTTANIVALAGAFKLAYPEASVTDIPLVIAFIAWSVATATDVILSKCFRPKEQEDHVGQGH